MHFLSPGETPPTMRLDRTDEEEKLILPSSATRESAHPLGSQPHSSPTRTPRFRRHNPGSDGIRARCYRHALLKRHHSLTALNITAQTDYPHPLTLAPRQYHHYHRPYILAIDINLCISIVHRKSVVQQRDVTLVSSPLYRPCSWYIYAIALVYSCGCGCARRRGARPSSSRPPA